MISRVRSPGSIPRFAIYKLWNLDQIIWILRVSGGKKSDINSSYLLWIINKSSSAVFWEECLPLSNSQEALAVNINADLPEAFLWPACSTTKQLGSVLQHHANNPTGTWDVLKTDNPLGTWFSFLTSATYLACPHLSRSSLPLLFIASKHI